MTGPGPTGPGEPGVVYFLHVHKAAGIAMRRVLEARFPAGEVCPAARYSELVALGDPATLPYRLYCGHFGARIPARRPDVTILTTLRQPVARLRSHHAQIARFPGHPLHALVRSEAPSVAAFVRHPEGRFVVDNLQVRLLAAEDWPDTHDPREHPAARSAPRSAGLLRIAAPPDLPDDELLGRARERLASCAWVGTVERLGESVDLLGDRMGWPLVPPPRVHAHDGAQDIPDDDPATTDLIAELTRLDAVIYAEAEARLRREIVGMLERHLDRAAWTRLAERSRPLDGEVVVDAAQPWEGRGWWEVQEHATGPSRWTGPADEATIRLPLALPAGAVVEIGVVGSMFTDGSQGDDGTSDVAVAVGGRALVIRRRPGPGGATVMAVEVPVATGPVTEITIRTPPPVPWSDRHPGSRDAGRRGIAVGWVRLAVSSG
jgi:hypothetical protein